MSEAPKRPKLPPAYRLHALDSVASSNDEARRLAGEGAEDGTLVWALEQTGGRGRHGRSWVSPRGNLYVSAVLRPDCDLAEAAQLGFVAALGLGDALGSVMPPMTEVTFKWPNDVLVNDHKAAGILLESVTAPDGTLDALILGLGVNVAHAPADTPFPATSLHDEGSGHALEAATLLEHWSRHFLTWVNRWVDEGFPPIRRAWLNRAKGQGAAIEVRLPTRTLHGSFHDLDESGALLLDTAEGRERVHVGDVFFGPSGADAGPS